MRRRGIDFSDIPEASPAQLRAMRRVGRPPLGAAARRLIAIRIDPQVLDAVRREAKRRGLGYQSLINDLLAEHVRRARAPSGFQLAGSPGNKSPQGRRGDQGHR
jgi:uncharacterized protein (DUF4415 family)